MERIDSKDFLPYLDKEKISEEDFLELCFTEGLILEKNGDTWAIYEPVLMGNAEAVSGYAADRVEAGALEGDEDYEFMPADCAVHEMMARNFYDEEELKELGYEDE